MTDEVARFERLVREAALATPGASVQLLMAGLEPATGHLLKLCAIPHYYSPEILRVLEPGLSRDEADAIYPELVDLPVTMPLEDQVALHDQTRQFLFRQWLKHDCQAELAAVSQRLAAYFREEAQHAHGANRQGFELHFVFHLIGVDQTLGFAEMKRQWQKSYVQFRLSDCKSLLNLAREYHELLSPLHQAWLSYYDARLMTEAGEDQQAIDLLERLLNDPSTKEDTNLQIELRVRRGRILGQRGRWSEALVCFREARQLAELTGVASSIADCRFELGVALREEGLLNDSETELGASLGFFNDNNDVSGMARALNSLGTTYLNMGDFDRAMEAYRKSLDFLAKLGDHFGTAEVFNNLGKAFANQLWWQQAEENYRKSLEIKTQAGDTRGRATSLNNLVQVYRSLGRDQEALQVSEEAANLYYQLRDYQHAAVAKRNLARLYGSRQDAQASMQAYYADAMELFRKAGNLREAAALEQELKDIAAGIPWWAWISIMLIVILVAAVLAAEFLR